MELTFPKCRISLDWLLFQPWNWALPKSGNFYARLVQICSFSLMQLNLSTHTHRYLQVSFTLHNQSLDGLGWSIQHHGKELRHLKGETKKKKEVGKNWTYSAWRACGAKADTWTCPLFGLTQFELISCFYDNLLTKNNNNKWILARIWQMLEHSHYLNLPNLNLSVVVFNKKQQLKDFGQDMTNAWT